MTRLVLDRPPTDPGPVRVPGCRLCGIPPFDTDDQDLAGEFARVYSS